MIKKVVNATLLIMSGTILGIFLTAKKTEKILGILGANNAKSKALYEMLKKWITLKAEKKGICSYLEEKGYSTVAIYGISDIGEILLEELINENVVVKYAIDRNAAYIKTTVDVLAPDDDLPVADVVIVTAITFFDEIKSNLKTKIQCPILSLEEILDELLQQ